MCEVASFNDFEKSLTTVKVMTKTKVAPFYLGHGVVQSPPMTLGQEMRWLILQCHRAHARHPNPAEEEARLQCRKIFNTYMTERSCSVHHGWLAIDSSL